MASKNKINLLDTHGSISDGEFKITRQYLRNADGSLGDLNPEWLELENQDWEIDEAEFDDIFAGLDELLDNKSTEEPIDDTPVAPAHHMEVFTPIDMAERNAILAEVENMPDAALSDDTATGPKKPEASEVPVMSEPQKQETDFASLSTDQLLKLQRSLFSNSFAYTDAEKGFNQNIALELTKRDISPIKRDFPKYDRVTCNKIPEISAYMRDLQVFDLLWIWHTQNGHQTASEAHNGLFADIFTGAQFDFNRALAIAVGQFKTKAGKIGNLTVARKIGYLALPECWQEELAVLRSDTIRQRQGEAKNRARREREKLDALKVRAIDIRHRLQAYHDNHSRRTSLNVEVYTNVWLALEMSKGSRTYLADATRKYNEMTGESIKKSLMQRRLGYLEKALKQ